MKVEIWSDVMCPFCYLGKHYYEEALAEFPDSAHIKTIWKSFQLDPTIRSTDAAIDTYTYLSERKGFPVEQAIQMASGLAARAAQSGLTFNFDNAVVANTFDAHRLAHFARSEGFDNEMEERLFKAYFTEGKNVADQDTLTALGAAAGLEEEHVREVLESDRFADEVKEDVREAGALGVRGVPFFVFNRKYALSGAQPKEVFLQTLERAFSEWRAENPLTAFTVIKEGQVCDPDTGCEF